LRKENFSATGNFGFGIQEHIDLGIKYDPSIGIYGMDFYVVLGRPGFRISHRRQRKSRVGFQHRVTKDDAMKWFQQKVWCIQSLKKCIKSLHCWYFHMSYNSIHFLVTIMIKQLCGSASNMHFCCNFIVSCDMTCIQLNIHFYFVV
jgi:hypothetical protein